MSQKLIEEVRRSADGLGSNEAAKQAVDAVFDGIRRLTASGERVTIRGFGTFQQKMRGERTGRNPRTGEPVKIAAREQLVFKATK